MLKQTTILVLLSFFLIGTCLATQEENKKSHFYGVEIFTGIGNGSLREKKSYNFIPTYIDLDFNLKPIAQEIGLTYPGLLQFGLEPFASYVYSPDNNIEIGNNFLIKIGLTPDTWRLQPYFKVGIGFLYMTQHTLEQGSQFNFNEYTGAGFHYFFRPNMAFSAEYRYRHLSNAKIARPNAGINCNFYLCGIFYKF